MSKRELMQIQLDQLRWENKQLHDENARLRDQHGHEGSPASVAGVEAELAKCLEEQQQLEREIRTRSKLLRRSLGGGQEQNCNSDPETGSADGESQQETQLQQLQRELTQALERRDEAEAYCSQLQDDLRASRADAELQQFRAVEREREKWEDREQRWLAQLASLETRLHLIETTGLRSRSQSTSRSVERPPSSATPGCLPFSADTVKERSEGRSGSNKTTRDTAVVGASQLSDGADSGSVETTSKQSSVKPQARAQPVMQQTPPVSKFTGEGIGEETFEDWLIQFEMAAEVSGWEGKSKLAHLVTRLKGQALSYYRSCPPDEKTDYDKLTKALTTRFTRVQLPVVQSTLFHERKQRAKEDVDTYAQDLRNLFQKAYPKARQGSKEAEEMAKSVLAHQFAAGLLPELKVKVAGAEGTFEELLAKARLEEAKLRDLPATKQAKTSQATPNTGTGAENDGEKARGGTDRRSNIQCNNCHAYGHIARFCPKRGRGDTKEATGRPARNQSRVSALVPETQEESEDEVTNALEQVMATLHGLLTSSSDAPRTPTLGPVPKAILQVEGVPVEALVDTGAPVSIINLNFLLAALAKNRKPEQSPAEWRTEVEKRLEQPSFTNLQNYGGGELKLARQIRVSLSRVGGKTIEAVLQVQSNAPVDLLLGTDLQSQLGFVLMSVEEDGTGFDLLLEKQWKVVNSPVITTPNSETQQLAGTLNGTTVHLIQATRVPAQHSKMIRAKIDVNGRKSDEAFLFEPDYSEFSGQGLHIAEATVSPDLNNQVVLLIDNDSFNPVKLKKGMLLGTVNPVTVDPTPKDRETAKTDPAVALVTEKSDADRKEQVLKAVKVNSTGLSPEQLTQMQNLLKEYADIFSLHPSDLGTTDQITHSINTGDHEPIRQPPRRLPFSLRSKTNELVQEMLDQGVIQPSKSPWASPVVLVEKKDGSVRFCVDYRRLNAVTKMEVFPLPRIDDSLDMLSKSKFFSTLDLASGFWQVKMEPNSREKTAFVTHSGLYEFSVMPFGLVNAPSTFQRLMESVLAGLSGEKCIVYIDDILVPGATWPEHLQNLRQVFERLRSANLKLKSKKCRLAECEAEYLGYVISEDGLSTDPEKIRAVREFPVPHDVRTLRSFLGLASYYRRFVPNFSVVARPLHALTKKEVPFDWTESCRKSFERLKELLTTSPILVLPDFNKDFMLETDASGQGLGAVLAQKQEDGLVRPIAFASRTLQPHEQNYGITELEGLGVVWAMKHFRHYLYGHKCEVFTDHEALKSLLNTPHPSGKLARWGLTLQEFDVKIRYRPGRANASADALSRNPLPATETREVIPPFSILATLHPKVAAENGEDPNEELIEAQRKDPELLRVIQYLEDGTLPTEDKLAREIVLCKSQYVLIDKVLYHVERDKSLRLIPPQINRKKLFHDVHSGVYGGHLRDAKIHGELAKHYWWPGMRSDIVSWCRECITCATRQPGKKLKSPLVPIPVAGPFDRVGVDILQLPKSRLGNQYAIVFVDYLTKWPEVYPASDQSSLTVAELFVREFIPRHGVPRELLSDRGTSFLSKIMMEVYKLLGTHKVNTTAYHPQGDGLVECMNRSLLNMLSKSAESNGSDWDERLPFVLFAYRASTQESTKESPFYLLYGRDPQLPTSEMLEPQIDRITYNLDDYKTEMVKHMSEAWKLAQENVKHAQKSQKKHYDKGVREHKVKEGDRVFVYMPSAKKGKAHKLARPFHGPYRVIETVDNGVMVTPIDRPQETPIRVAMDRVRRCPKEIPDTFWPEHKKRGNQAKPAETKQPTVADAAPEPESTGVWAGRLRSRARTS